MASGLAALILAACVLVVVLPRSPNVGADFGQGPNADLDQQLAVPAYIDPTANPGAWTQLTSPEPNSLGIVVANVDSGPNTAANPAWATVIHQAAATGAKVLGYVDTGYLGTPIEGHSDGLPTRSGLTGLGAWLPQIESDINAWYSFYGTNMGGIFFDEATNVCGPSASSDQYAREYQTLSTYVKQIDPDAFVAINPGTAVPKCYESAADVLVTFEGSYGDYTGSTPSPDGAYQPLSWTPLDPYEIWHIIYGATSRSQMQQVMALSKSRDAGLVYVTNAIPADPYDTLPPESYWSNEEDESFPFGNPGSQSASTPAGLTASAWSSDATVTLARRASIGASAQSSLMTSTKAASGPKRQMRTRST
jgi:hypothetical protein